MATVRGNERSWAIEIISKINSITAKNDLLIKCAGGESTISTNAGGRMFPDVVLYGDNEQTVILQGWELKMPDVPIENDAFIKDAQRKAIALNLNSCLIWNFTYAVLYIRENGDDFIKLKQWDDTSYIHTREDVKTYKENWEALLEEIIIEINGYFSTGQFKTSSLGEIISIGIVTRLISRNKDIIAEKLKSSGIRDSVLAAYIDDWWLSVKAEYEHDEQDKYKAYAKTVVLNWANRIAFAHLIKSRQNSAMLINTLDHSTTPAEANGLFSRITAKCDFYNVFSPLKYNDILPESSWQDLVEYSDFLKNNGIEHLDQEALQNILEGTVAASKRAVNGQFTTPTELAKLLVRLTVKDWTGNVLDCCCGTGTISKAVIQIKKKSQLPAKEAVGSVWACDKYNYPLQIANISMTGFDTINLANRLFQHNALTLEVGEKIEIVDPESGDKIQLSLPAFDAVVSNLPFVPFELIPADDKDEIAKLPFVSELDGRSDLYCYIATKIADVIKPGGMLGIIVSNSWLGTNAGNRLVEVLKKRYNIKQVHISGSGRWFKNADIVTTILVLEKKNDARKSKTAFWVWKKSLDEFSEDSDSENILINSSLLNREIDKNVAKMSYYSQEQIDEILGLNVSYNALFHNVDWLPDIRAKIIPISTVFRVFRGSRRGWDPLFYPKKGTHKIENEYLRPVLINARNVTKLVTAAEDDAFCCSLSLADLRSLGHTGALDWISKFSGQRNGVGKPLPSVLKRTGMEWYELKENEIAEFFTMMNPDQRLFFAKFDTPSFVNQRLIGLNHRNDYPDLELDHALLNSMLTMFCIEAAGFGRGLGVLDVNKDSISKCYMLDPKLVDRTNRDKILSAFEKVKARNIMRVSDELNDASRLEFEHAVLGSFGLDGYFDKIKSSLLSMQRARATAKNK